MSAAVPAALATTTVLQLQQTSLSAPPSKCQAFGQGDPDAWIIQIFVAFLLWALVSNVKLGGFFNTPLTAADAQDAGGSYFEHILLCTTSVAFGHWASLVSV